MSPSSPVHRILDALWAALPAQVGAIGSVVAELGPFELAHDWTPGPGTYFAELEHAEPSDAGSATLVMAFELPLAIACAGQLVLTPEAEIQDKIAKSELGPADLEAMGECVNTFAAAIADAVRKVLGEDRRFVVRKGALEAPDVASLGPVVVAGGELKLGDLASGRLEIVVPESLWRAEGANRRGEPVESASDGGGVELTAEELAAIRAATQSSLAGKTLLVVPSISQRDEWTTLLEQSGIDFEFVADPFHLLRLCRTESIDAIVIDADACPSGGLPILAALRGRTHEPLARVVVASRPTRTHLVSCMAAGATAYLPKPIAADALREHLG
ncbi:MAG TPA: response regulator [Nannocystaceae bacterium]|nr:response regulator [Nannocystaceae bacterium]